MSGVHYMENFLQQSKFLCPTEKLQQHTLIKVDNDDDDNNKHMRLTYLIDCKRLLSIHIV